MVKRIVAAIVAVSLLSACAGRAPQPVQITQPRDQTMDCMQINTEIQADAAHISELQHEEGNKRGQNVAAGVAGAILFWPALFLMDFQDAAGNERKALEARDQYLSVLATQRCQQQKGGWIGATQTNP